MHAFQPCLLAHCLKVACILALTFIAPFSAFAQSDQEEIEAHIEKIRSIYYSTAELKHEQVEWEKATYYLLEGEVKRISYTDQDITYNFHFDKTYNQRLPYFIYTIFQDGNETHENRFYFSGDNEFIRWLGPKKEAIQSIDESDCARVIQIVNLALEKHHAFITQQALADKPEYTAMAKAADELAADIDAMTLREDTLMYEDPEEPWVSGEFDYYDAAGNKRRHLYFYGHEHGGAEAIDFYTPDGELFLTKINSDLMYAGSEERLHYYRNGEMYRLVTTLSIEAYGFHPSCQLVFIGGGQQVYNDPVEGEVPDPIEYPTSGR